MAASKTFVPSSPSAETARLPDLQIGSLPATCELRVLSCVDAAQPLHRQAENHKNMHNNKRLLRMQLTDGCRQCGAFEYSPFLTSPTPQSVAPGATIRVHAGTRIQGGLLLLEPDRVDFLGGAPQTAHEIADPRSDGNTEGAAPKFTPLPNPPVQEAPPSRSPRLCSTAAPAATASAPNRKPATAAAALTRGYAAVEPRASKPQIQPPSATIPPALDADLIEQLLATGLSLEEVHSSLGLPAPQAAIS